MANQLGSLTIAPRAYSQHQRYRKYARIRAGADQFTAFLAAQAARFTGGHTAQNVFDKLPKNSAARIKATATGSFGSLS